MPIKTNANEGTSTNLSENSKLNTNPEKHTNLAIKFAPRRVGFSDFKIPSKIPSNAQTQTPSKQANIEEPIITTLNQLIKSVEIDLKQELKKPEKQPPQTNTAEKKQIVLTEFQTDLSSSFLPRTEIKPASRNWKNKSENTTKQNLTRVNTSNQDDFFNNQAILFENVSMFGILSKQIHQNKQIPNKPLFNRLKNNSIKHIPIESPEKLESRFIFLRSKKTSNSIKDKWLNISFKVLLYSLIFSVLFSVLIVFNNSKIANNYSSASQNIINQDEFKKNNITFSKNELIKKSNNSLNLQNFNLDTNQNGFSSWQDVYIELDPVNLNQNCPNRINNLDALLNFENPKNCKKINLKEISTNENKKLLEVLRYILIDKSLTAKGDVSLTTIFNTSNIEDIEKNTNLYEKNPSAKKILIQNSKINTLIQSSLVNTQNNSKPSLSGLYFIEASNLYQVKPEILLAFSKIDNNYAVINNTVFSSFDVFEKSLFTQENLYKMTSFIAQSYKLNLDICEKLILINDKYGNCLEIQNVIERIKIDLI